MTAVAKKPFPPGMPVGPGDVIAGKYRIDELLAVGGMGIIVAAQHLQLGQEVAIKVLLPSEAAEEGQAIPRFLREARAAAGIRSENVVRIYDVDTLGDGLPYIVMELLEGIDLRKLVKTQGQLPVEQAVDFLLQAADAIEEAHRLGIVHRDIKPSNLFLTRRKDGRPLIKVLDFGISKASHDAFDGTLTTSRAMIGSPMYMSPEQVRDSKSVDSRSDIWSLGVILYELLAGRSAFRGDSLPSICAAIAADPPAPLGDFRSDVPAELENIVMRCLAKHPDDRYQTVDDLAAALLPFLPHDMPYAPTVPAPSGSQPPSSFRGAAVPSHSFRPALPSAPAVTTRPNPLRARALRGESSDPAASSGPLSASGSLSPSARAQPLARVADARSASQPSYTSSAGARPARPSEGDVDTLPTSRYTGSSEHPGPPSGRDPASPPNVAELVTSDGPYARTGMGTSSESSRRALWVVAAALALALVATTTFLLTRPAPTPSAAPAPVAATSFSLKIESTPAGAEVREGERVHGVTPLEIGIDTQSVHERAREFTLRLPGHRPHSIVQGMSATDVRVQAALIPEETPPVAAPTPPIKRSGQTARGSRPAAPKSSARPSTTGGTDIRLER